MIVPFVALACSVAPRPVPASDPPASPAPFAPAAPPDEAASTAPIEAKYAATHVLVAFRGAVRAPSDVTRTEEEARARAMSIWRRAEAGEPLEELARALSDSPSAPRGGRIGVYVPGTMAPELERAVAAVAIGEVTRPFRSAYGWHVARRDAVVEARLRHVVVAWKGAWRSSATRSRKDARARIEAALARLEAGEDFAVVARELSDDPSGRAGGDLGVVAQGQLIPAFEEAAFALAPGQRSGVVETPYGFHVIERLP